VSLYAVQIGPYATRRAAAASRGHLAHKGYTAVLRGRTLRLGSFSQRGLAERLAKRLGSTGYRTTVVALR
jgi:cell division protein FtsN